jgi:hypothetical protein
MQKDTSWILKGIFLDFIYKDASWGHKVALKKRKKKAALLRQPF